MLDFYCEYSHNILWQDCQMCTCCHSCVYPLSICLHILLPKVWEKICYGGSCTKCNFIPKRINLCSYKLSYLSHLLLSQLLIDIYNNLQSWPMPWLRQLVPGFPMWWPRFNLGSGHLGLVVKVAMQQVFSEYFFPLFIFIPPDATYSWVNMTWYWNWQHH